MTLKLTLTIIGPYESDPLEVWYQPKDIPSDPTQYELFSKTIFGVSFVKRLAITSIISLMTILNCFPQ